MQINSDMMFEMLEANLKSLSVRVPDVPVTSILLCRMILNLGREMAAMFEQHIRPHGLTEAEFRVLTTLYSHANGTAHPGDLCARTSQSPANMSRISDALVDRKLITRVLSAQDRRRMVMRITEHGEELVRDLLPKMFAPLKELMKDFPETEQRQLIGQLKRVWQLVDGRAPRDTAECHA
jgi:MarR family transcriptional regulator, negative regulator of the multidrug operon emrRAB